MIWLRCFWTPCIVLYWEKYTAIGNWTSLRHTLKAIKKLRAGFAVVAPQYFVDSPSVMRCHLQTDGSYHKRAATRKEIGVVKSGEKAACCADSGGRRGRHIGSIATTLYDIGFEIMR
jgi:hypothetical protein